MQLMWRVMQAHSHAKTRWCFIDAEYAGEKQELRACQWDIVRGIFLEKSSQRYEKGESEHIYIREDEG